MSELRCWRCGQGYGEEGGQKYCGRNDTKDSEHSWTVDGGRPLDADNQALINEAARATSQEKFYGDVSTVAVGKATDSSGYAREVRKFKAEAAKNIQFVLDHGYVQVIEHWGSDERIIEAARMSTNKGFEGWGSKASCKRCGEEIPTGIDQLPMCRDGAGCEVVFKPGDEKLLRYLWEHKHATPFEMAGMVIEVQAPIFVFREWHRHRTQSYNEASARYIPLPDLNYLPTVERIMLNAGTSNKQAGTVVGSKILTEEEARSFQHTLRCAYEETQGWYETALGKGVPKELARLLLPVGRYSKMRASANLRNWIGFLLLRMDKGAQWEIRQYAEAVHAMLAQRFPRTLALFDEGMK